MNDTVQNDITCKTCGNIFKGQYCNACGQKEIKRFTGSFLWQAFHKDVFEIDNGLWLTYRELWLRPGKMVLSYIHGATKKYYSPLKYLIFWTALYLIIQPFVTKSDQNFLENQTIDDLIGNTHEPFSKGSLQDLSSLWFHFMTLNTTYYFITLIPFISVVSYFVFRKHKFNLTELVILYTYFFGHFASLLLVIVFIAPDSNSLNEFMTSTIAMVIFFIPYFYVFFKMHKEFFQERWSTTILKGLGSLYGGMLVYFVLLFLLFNIVKLFV